MRKLIPLLCLCASGAWASITAPSNCAVNSGGSGTTIFTAAFGTVASTCATAASNTAGNHITVYIAYKNSGGTSITTGCTDHAGNTYTLVFGTVQNYGAAKQTVDMCYADNIAGASGNFVTVALSGTPSAGGQFAYAEEVAGVATSSSLDGSIVTNVATTGLSISEAISTVAANDIVCAVVASSATRGTNTAGSGFTLGRNAASISTEYDLVTTPGSYTAAMSYTTTEDTIIMVAAFKPPGAASAQIRHRVEAQ